MLVIFLLALSASISVRECAHRPDSGHVCEPTITDSRDREADGTWRESHLGRQGGKLSGKVVNAMPT